MGLEGTGWSGGEQGGSIGGSDLADPQENQDTDEGGNGLGPDGMGRVRKGIWQVQGDEQGPEGGGGL